MRKLLILILILAAALGVQAALDLARQSGTITLVSDPAQAQAFVLNGTVPSDAAAIADRVKQGAGLLLIMGKDVKAAVHVPVRPVRRLG